MSYNFKATLQTTFGLNIFAVDLLVNNGLKVIAQNNNEI